MKQVKESPDIDTERPVSRQMEAHVYDYYGWDPYWGGIYFPISNAMATPLVAPPPATEGSLLERARADARIGDDDPHLRSIVAVTGYHIHATDGEIGHVEESLLNEVGWSIRYVVVDTRNWGPERGS
jgi:hypothetical protein